MLQLGRAHLVAVVSFEVPFLFALDSLPLAVGSVAACRARGFKPLMLLLFSVMSAAGHDAHLLLCVFGGCYQV